MSIRTFSRRAAAAAAFTFAVAAFAHSAAAQTTSFGVSAQVTTGGYAGGTSNVLTGALFGQTFTTLTSDPAGRQFGINPNQQLYADVGASVQVAPGRIQGSASSLAQRINATSFPSSPTAAHEGKFFDRLTVTADLPAGTPVTLYFRTELEVVADGVGLYDGSITSNLSIGGASASARWAVATGVDPLPVPVHLVEVRTTVGARLAIDHRINTFARGSYFVPGPVYDGSLRLDVIARTWLLGASADVTLVAASGADYNNRPN